MRRAADLPDCGRRIPAGETGCPACAAGRATVDAGVIIEPVTGMELVFVPGGTFQMGDLFGDGWANELPVQRCGSTLSSSRHSR